MVSGRGRLCEWPVVGGGSGRGSGVCEWLCCVVLRWAVVVCVCPATRRGEERRRPAGVCVCVARPPGTRGRRSGPSGPSAGAVQSGCYSVLPLLCSCSVILPWLAGWLGSGTTTTGTALRTVLGCVGSPAEKGGTHPQHAAPHALRRARRSATDGGPDPWPGEQGVAVAVWPWRGGFHVSFS